MQDAVLTRYGLVPGGRKPQPGRRGDVCAAHLPGQVRGPSGPRADDRRTFPILFPQDTHQERALLGEPQKTVSVSEHPRKDKTATTVPSQASCGGKGCLLIISEIIKLLF